MAKKETSSKVPAAPEKKKRGRPSNADRAKAAVAPKDREDSNGHLVVEAATSMATLLVQRQALDKEIKRTKKHLDSLRAQRTDMDDRIEHQGDNLLSHSHPAGRRRALPFTDETPALNAAATAIAENAAKGKRAVDAPPDPDAPESQQATKTVKFKLPGGAKWEAGYYEDGGKLINTGLSLTMPDGQVVAVAKVPNKFGRLDDLVALAIEFTIDKLSRAPASAEGPPIIEDLQAKRRKQQGYENSPDYNPTKG